jgi:ribonuclease VapC
VIVVDTSAVIALLEDEADAALYTSALVAADGLTMSAANVLECSLVIESRYGEVGRERLDGFLTQVEVEVAAFDAEQVMLARAAFRRFGRGRHPAQLNFGDCFAYALAKQRGASLLYKGNDFSQTDVASALA